MSKISGNHRIYHNRSRSVSKRTCGQNSNNPKETLTLSEQSDVGKTTLFSTVGAAIGVGAAALLAPAFTLGIALVGATIGGISGAAISKGALEDAGTVKREPFDPYNHDHLSDFDNFSNPENPYSWLYWGDK